MNSFTSSTSVYGKSEVMSKFTKTLSLLGFKSLIQLMKSVVDVKLWFADGKKWFSEGTSAILRKYVEPKHFLTIGLKR